MKVAQLTGLGLFIFMILMSTNSFASSLIGFSTDTPSYYSIDQDNSQMRIDFGDLLVTNAVHNGVAVSSIIGAEVIIADVFIDLATKQVLSSFGGHDLVYYELDPKTAILNGFQVVLNNQIILSGDLLLYDIFLFGKTGSIDPDIQINVVAPDTSSFDPEITALFADFAIGGDLNITIEDIHSDDIAQQIENLNSIEGTVGGTFSSINTPVIPEPATLILIISSLIGLINRYKIHR